MKTPPETACRAVTFPFFPGPGRTWKELDPLLHQCWQQSTQLANWAMSELTLADRLTVNRSADKLGPMPDCYLYGLFTRSYRHKDDWAGAMSAANCVLQGVRKKYLEKRLDVVWRGSCSLPSYRYGYPYPVHNQCWKAYYGPDNVPLVDASLPGGKVTLRLRGGPEMGRQLAGFRRIVEGAKRGELALYRKGRHSMVKLVAHFPLAAPQEAHKTMLVKTDPNALWVVEIEGTHTRVWNQDHIRQVVETHQRWLRRVSEDTKREKRVPRPMRRHIDQAREDRCRKNHDRLDTFCHEMSKQLVEFAVRQKMAVVIYDDEIKSYVDPFPWFQLKTKLKYKLEERGITFLARSAGPNLSEGEANVQP